MADKKQSGEEQRPEQEPKMQRSAFGDQVVRAGDDVGPADVENGENGFGRFGDEDGLGGPNGPPLKVAAKVALQRRKRFAATDTKSLLLAFFASETRRALRFVFQRENLRPPIPPQPTLSTAQSPQNARN